MSETIGVQLQRTYQYDAIGRRLTQLKKDTDGTGPEVAEDSHHGYNPHTDVETLTKDNGDKRSAYGYTAYGKDDKEAFTGSTSRTSSSPARNRSTSTASTASASTRRRARTTWVSVTTTQA